jgi:hypothetical protein
MTLKMTSTPYYLIPYLQPFQNGGRLNFWGDAIFNPIASIILQLLRFKVVRRALLSSVFGLFMFNGNHGNQVVYCKLM